MDAAHTLVENVAPHSVTLSTNAKGGVQAEVKVYDADPQRAALRAAEVLEALRRKYPAMVAA